MERYLYLILFIFGSLNVSAQKGGLLNQLPHHACENCSSKKSGNLGKDYIEAWYDISDCIINSSLMPGAFIANVNFIMPDSNGVFITPSGLKYHLMIHNTGFVFDPKDVNLLNSTLTPPAVQLSRTPYILDSIRFNYLYVRNVDSVGPENSKVKVIDTLILQLYKMPALAKGTLSTPIGNQVYAKPAYVPATNKGASSTQEVVVLLTGDQNQYVQNSTSDSTTTDNETSWRIKTMTIPCNLSVNVAGSLDNIAAYSISFRPMLRPAPGDTVITGQSHKPVNRYNYFGYRYFVNTGGNEVQVPQQQYHNNSIYVRKETRYGQTHEGWTGFIPGNAYQQALYNDFYYHLNALVGIKDHLNITGIQTYPNPATDQLSISFALESPETIITTVSDITGKQLLRSTEQKFSSGKNELTIDCATLAPGTYFYSLKTESIIKSGKMLIVR